MKRKSFGKLAIVALLSVAMLLTLCVCSKSDKKAGTTTTTATAPTTTTTTTTPAPAPAATPAPAPVQETKTEPAPAPAPVEETPAPVVEVKAEEPAPVVEEKVEEPAPVEETFSIAADGTVKAVYDYRALAAAQIVVEDGVATVTYPASLIYTSDIDGYVYNLVSTFPVLKDFITYSIPEEGTLVVTYPEGLATSYVVEALAYLNDDVTSYIDGFLASYLVEDAVEETVEVVEAPVVSTTIATHGLTAKIDAYADHAFITVPAGTTYDDVVAVASVLVQAYPIATEAQFAFADGVVTLTYPALPESFIATAVAQLESDAKWYADQMFGTAVAVVEEPAPVVEEVAVVEAPVVSTTISAAGLSAKVEAYADHAFITVPAGTTADDVYGIAAALVQAYPVAAEAQFTFDGNVVALTYPALPESFIATAVAQLESDAKWAASQLTAVATATATAKEEPAPAAPAPVAEPAPAPVAEAPVAEAPKAEEPAPAPAPVEAPAVKAVETLNKFSVGFAASGDYNVTNGWFYPTFEGRVEYALAPSFSVGAKVGYAMDGYITLKGGVKYNLPLAGLYVYGDAGARIGVGPITGGLTAFAGGVGVGFEMAVSENAKSFFEFGAEFGKAVTLGAKVGAKITF